MMHCRAGSAAFPNEGLFLLTALTERGHKAVLLPLSGGGIHFDHLNMFSLFFGTDSKEILKKNSEFTDSVGWRNMIDN